MKTKLLYVLALLWCISSCNIKENRMEIENNSIDELKQKINLEGINPLSVKFTINELEHNKGREIGPNDYNLVAVLKLSKPDWENLKENYSKNKPDINSEIYLDEDFIKKWFSDSVKNSFFLEDGYYRIRPKVYFPDRFLKSPFVGGMLFFTTDNQIFIFMHTT